MINPENAISNKNQDNLDEILDINNQAQSNSNGDQNKDKKEEKCDDILDYQFYHTVFHEKPVAKCSGTLNTLDGTLIQETYQQTHLEITIKLGREQYFKKLTEFYGDKADSLSIVILASVINEARKSNKTNKKIVNSYQDMIACINFVSPDDKVEYCFYNVADLARFTARSRCNLGVTNALLKNFRFSLGTYVNCIRAAIRNQNVKLLTTILKKQSDMSWENYFPFIVEERDEYPDYEYHDFFRVNHIPTHTLRQMLDNSPNHISDSPLSYALRKGCNSKIIKILLQFNAHSVLNCSGHTIDVSKELAEFQKTQKDQKFAFLMAFNARLGQDSAIFKQFGKSDTADPKRLTKMIFECL